MILVWSTRSTHTCDESTILTKPPAPVGIFGSRNQFLPIYSGVSWACAAACYNPALTRGWLSSRCQLHSPFSARHLGFFGGQTLFLVQKSILNRILNRIQNSIRPEWAVLLHMNSEPVLSIGLLTMSAWCVELCLQGPISLLHSLYSNVRVCPDSLLQHSRILSKIKSMIAGAKWYATEWSRTPWLLSKCPGLSSCFPPSVGLKEFTFALMWATTKLNRHWKRLLRRHSPSSQ